MSVERVRAILSEIEQMGARVELTPSNTEELAVLRARLGFDPPEEYVSFCMELGGITIELVRTWLFYGAKDNASAPGGRGRSARAARAR
jgi:hypothetical protein